MLIIRRKSILQIKEDRAEKDRIDKNNIEWDNTEKNETGQMIPNPINTLYKIQNTCYETQDITFERENSKQTDLRIYILQNNPITHQKSYSV